MYKHILITTDGSKLAEKGVAHGLELAKAVGAKATIVTVTEDWSPVEMASQIQSGRRDVVTNYERMAKESAQAILDSAIELAKRQQVEAIQLHVENSHPAEGILQAAKDTGADIIVMASHGRRGMRRLFLGSQASEVLAHTTLPVLILRNQTE